MERIKRKLFGMLLLFGMLSSFSAVSAQEIPTIISGMVADTNGEALIGVSVEIKGTQIGTVTDLEGRFSLSGNFAGAPVLLFSYLGFDNVEATFAGQALRIVMTERSQDLDEVVVVGYGVQRKKDLTGSTSSVGSAALQDKPVANIGEALQGRAAGVMVNNSGAPGSNSTIRIRGIGSINDCSPLLVIDGIPTDLALNAINQNDVESIDILKDASATAIYGSRGANGIVLISTKKGKGTNKGTLSFSANAGVQQGMGAPQLLNASQFASVHNEMMANAGLTQRPDFADPTSWGEGTNWYDELTQTGVIQNYSLAYSRASEHSNTYVSGNVFDQKGIIINTDYRRYSFQFNNEAKVLPWLKFGNNLTFSHDRKRNGSYDVLNTLRALPTQPVMEDGDYSGPDGQSVWYGDIRNPIGTATLEKNETTGYNVLGNLYGEATILKKVVFKMVGGVDYKDWTTTSFSPKHAWKPIAVPASSLNESWYRSVTYLWDNTLTYSDTFNDSHHLNVMIGSSAQNNLYRYINGSITSFLSDDYNQLNNGLLEPLVGGSRSEWALLSFFGRLNYNYLNRYLFTATVRRDGTSRIAKGNRWGTFPSFSAAWRFTEEPFYKKNDILNDGKLRVGYGVTGNQSPLDNYAYITRLKTGQYVFGGTPVSTLYPLVMASPNIKWETVKQWNVGLDFALFQQRLNVTIDGYIKNTSNMLVSMSVPITTGYSDIYTPQINAGEVLNRGVELTLSSLNFKGDFVWTTDVNVSYNKNKILKLDGDVPIYSDYQVQSVGHPVGTFYGYVTDGIFQNWDEVNNSAIQIAGGTSPGDIRFKDLDNNGVINENDRTYLGDPTPSWIFSMSNNFSYKGFDLEIYLQGVAGNKIYNANRIALEGMSTITNQSVRVLDRWTGEGTSNSIPRAVYADPNNNNRVSDRFLEDGSYLRLKSLTLGYTFPSKWMSKAKISSARIYMTANNIFTLTRYSGFDPEILGVDHSNYPLTSTWSFGLDVKF